MSRSLTVVLAAVFLTSGCGSVSSGNVPAVGVDGEEYLPGESHPSVPSRGRVPAIAVDGEEYLPGEIHDAVMGRHGAEVDQCLDEARASAPDRVGRIAVTFVVEPDGEAREARAIVDTTGSKGLASCLTSVLEQVELSPRPHTRAVIYPFFLRSPELPVPPPTVIVFGEVSGREGRVRDEIEERVEANVPGMAACLQEHGERLLLSWGDPGVELALKVIVTKSGEVRNVKVDGPREDAHRPRLASCLLLEALDVRQWRFAEAEELAIITVPFTVLPVPVTSFEERTWNVIHGRGAVFPRATSAAPECERPEGRGIVSCYSVTECSEQCDAGCWDSCLWLGTIWLRGSGKGQAALRRACELDPGSCDSLVGQDQLSNCRRQGSAKGKGCSRKAERLIGKACEGGNVVACTDLARLLVVQGRMEEAEPPARVACTVGHDCALLAQALGSAGLTVESEIAYAVHCRLGELEGCLALARVLTERGLLDQAAAAFEPVLPSELYHRRDIEDDAVLHAARFALAAEQPKEAQRLARYAIERHMSSKRARVLLADALAAQGRASEALVEYRRALGHGAPREVKKEIAAGLDRLEAAHPELREEIARLRDDL